MTNLDYQIPIGIAELAIWDVELEQLSPGSADLDYRYGALRAHAAALHRLGVIDEAEHHERIELADAAYAYAVDARPDR